jgi:hypothetical protein
VTYKKLLMLGILLAFFLPNAGCQSTSNFVVGEKELIFGKAGEQPPVVQHDWALLSRSYWKDKVETCQ